MESTLKGSKTMVSLCCVAISGVFLLYKVYYRKPRVKMPKRTTLQNLPGHLIVEIFSHLTVEDFFNCTTVWKQLKLLREERYFCKKFMMCKKPTYFCNYVLTDSDKDTKTRITRNLATCDGLKLKLQYKKNGDDTWNFTLYIKNPGTREILSLPKTPNKKPRVDYAFAFVPLAGVYKVASVYQEDNKVKCGVLTLGDIENQWRDLDTPEISANSLVVVQSGSVVHCVRDFKDAHEILSLDLETECFTDISVAKSFIAEEKEDNKHWAINWHERLSFVYIERKKLNVLVLEDYKKPKWAKKLVISLSFLEEEIYNHEEIVPISAQNGLLWFKIGDERMGFDLEAGKIAQKLSGNPSSNVHLENRVFSLVPSIITLNGMQPYKEEATNPSHNLVNYHPDVNYLPVIRNLLSTCVTRSERRMCSYTPPFQNWTHSRLQVLSQLGSKLPNGFPLGPLASCRASSR